MAPKSRKPGPKQQQAAADAVPAAAAAPAAGGRGSALLVPVAVLFSALLAKRFWLDSGGTDGVARAFSAAYEAATAQRGERKEEIDDEEEAVEDARRAWWRRATFFEGGEDDGILHVDTRNFNSTVAGAAVPVLLAFCDPRSESFRDLRRHLEETGEELARRRDAGAPFGLLGAVDVTVDTWLAAREAPELQSGWQGTQGAFRFGRARYYPMIIRAFSQGERLGEYTGVVSAKQMLKFLAHLHLPKGGAVLDSTEALGAFVLRDGPLVLGCGMLDGLPEAAVFDAMAKSVWGSVPVGRAPAELCGEALPGTAIAGPTLVWLRGGGSASPPRTTTEGKFLANATAMRKWLSSHKTLAEMTPDNSHVFLDSPEPLVLFLVNAARPAAMSLAEALVVDVEASIAEAREAGGAVGEFQFVWSDCKEFGSQFRVKKECAILPVVALVNTVTLEHKTLKIEDLVQNSMPGDDSPEARNARAEELLIWLRLGSKTWRPDKTEKDRNAEAAAEQAANDTADGGGGVLGPRRFRDRGEALEPTTDAAWFTRAARTSVFKADDPHFTFNAYHELLHHMAKLKESFDFAHAGYLQFDFSELEAVQRLHPGLGAMPMAAEIKSAMGSRRAMRGLWRRVEARAELLAALAQPAAQKNGTLRELGARASEGFRRLEKLFQALFEALHDAERQGRVTLPQHRTRKVERRDASELSASEFLEKYASKGEPVIISGLQLSAQPLSLDFFSRICNKSVTLQRKNNSKRSWGRLEDAGKLPLSEFIATFTTNATRKDWYLHDWSLPMQCPDALGEAPYEGFTVPKYFAGDYFQRSGFSGYMHSWPSLFIGSELTESAVHIDSGNTNFWMYLLSGRKEWRFYRRRDVINLYMRPATAHFFPDIFRPVHDFFPLLKYAEMYEGIQEPGDLMFIPAGNPHGVRNLEPIHGISMNYVDGSNIWLYLEEALATQQYMEFELFTDNMSIPMGMRSAQEPLSFGEWKSQRWRDIDDFDLFF